VAEPVALSNKQVLPLETAVLPKILALLPYPVLIFSEKKVILYVNVAFGAWLNYSSEQIVKRPLGHCLQKTSSSWGQKGDCLVFKDREGLSHTALLLHTFPLETPKAVCLILGSSAPKTSQPFGQKILQRSFGQKILQISQGAYPFPPLL